ncbi:MAG: ribonuclease HII [Acidobacteriota bacterium]|nr:ribonuclease HII [Acidobacteriota bacterium]
MVRVRAFRTIENAVRREGYTCVAGVDEVGRGCLAGPVVAGAVALDPRKYVPRIADSKTVTALEREHLFDRIVRAAVAWSVSIVEPDEIDRLNIHRASLQAMHRAVMSMAPLPDFVLVDAFTIPDIPMAQRAVVHGDAKCTAIAAASILAKVTRDRIMRVLHAADPRYGFDRHKGYATKDHLEAVTLHGYSSAHRKTFRAQGKVFDTVVGTWQRVAQVGMVDGGEVGLVSEVAAVALDPTADVTLTTPPTAPTTPTVHGTHPSNVPTYPRRDDGL